jgi:MoaA/NifB/PqqE/SkfB family radical SAM enzyme
MTTPWIGPDGRVMRRLELHITYTCPERCVFCSEAHRMQQFGRFPVTWGRIATVLRTHATRGVRNLHLTGGEPTIHPRFVDVLKLAQKLGMRTSVGTIGTMLSRPAFAEAALPHLNEALFSLHGPTDDVHDPLAGRAGSFDTVTQALRHGAAAPNFLPMVNTVVTRANVAALPDTVALAVRLGARNVVVSNLTPEGAGLDVFDEHAVDLKDLAAVVDAAAEAAGEATIRFFGFPMCLLGERWASSNDLHWDPRVTVEWASEPGVVRLAEFYNWAPDRKRVHVESCTGCARRSVCTGVFDRYAATRPTGALVTQ